MKWVKQIKEWLVRCWMVQCRLWGKFQQLTMRDGSFISHEQPPYSHCWNCGAELVGAYCHKCGQEATPKHPGMWAFISSISRMYLCLNERLYPHFPI